MYFYYLEAVDIVFYIIFYYLVKIGPFVERVWNNESVLQKLNLKHDKNMEQIHFILTAIQLQYMDTTALKYRSTCNKGCS